MKVIYHHLPRTNFGDELNSWLWNTVCPGVFDNDTSVLVLGIGSSLPGALNALRRMPPRTRFAVLGQGAGYRSARFSFGRSFPWKVTDVCSIPARDRAWVSREDPRWKIYWVRGPLTTRILGLPPDLAIADGALLLRAVAKDLQLPDTRPRTVGLIPHYYSAHASNLRELCGILNFQFIDPTADTRETLRRIRSCSLVICEALHGAIAADALRVPWVPITASNGILEFKWLDYCASVGVLYRPLTVPVVWNATELAADAVSYMTGSSEGRKSVARALLKGACMVRTLSRNARNHDAALSALLRASAQPPTLATDTVIDSLVDRMLDKIRSLTADVRDGYWVTTPAVGSSFPQQIP